MAKIKPQPTAALVMLTGDQIKAVRRLLGIEFQHELAALSGVSVPTIVRAEGAKERVPAMLTTLMVAIVKTFMDAGARFEIDQDGRLVVETKEGMTTFRPIGPKAKRPRRSPC